MAARATGERPVSPTTAAAIRFVGERLPAAQQLGRDLADLVDDPEAFVAAFHSGIASLTDETYRREQSRVAPGLDDSLGLRLPLVTAIRRGFDRGARRAGPDSLLWLAERLLRERGLEIRILAFELLTRVLPRDPERAWQVLRQAARDAHEWITVDSLAHAYGAGILAEPRRWAEIEQLAYSPSRWERRLVGSTIATIPFIKRNEGRQPGIATHALPILGNVIGDAEPDVQKALAWAIRSLVRVDAAAVTRFAEQQSTIARTNDDGHRAWVIRDALPALEPAAAASIRERLAHIRRRPGAPPTSEAAGMAARFAGLVEATPRASGPRTADDFTGQPDLASRDRHNADATNGASDPAPPAPSAQGPRERSATGVTA